MIYILIIVTHVYYGGVVSSMEFNNRQSCETAKAAVVAMAWRTGGFSDKRSVEAACLPKGEQ